jgi:hypothetical protein
LQGAGKTFQDLVGRLMVSSLLESKVVLSADPGKHRDFFAAQSLDSPPIAVGQTHISRLDQFAARSQKGCQRAG